MSEKNTRKNILAPSILAADFSVLGQQIKEAAGALVEKYGLDGKGIYEAVKKFVK